MNLRSFFKNMNAQTPLVWAIMTIFLVTACPPKKTDPTVTPAKLQVEAQLDFGKTETAKRFTVQNTGGETLTWSSSSDRDWLTLAPDKGEVQAAQTVTVTVTVDRTKLTTGANTANLRLAAQKEGTDIDGSPVNVAVQAFKAALPTVRFEAKDLTNLQADRATAAGELVSLGSSPVTEHGHVWSVNQDVALGKPNVSQTTLGARAAVSKFNSSLKNLDAGQTYYVRAYATNTEGTGYSAELKFNTSRVLPTLIFKPADLRAIGRTSATAAATLTGLGSTPIIQRGHVWSLTASPTLLSAGIGKTELGTATTPGAFSSSLTGLTAEQTYFVRAYIRTTSDTVYTAALTLATLGALNLDRTSIAENQAGGTTVGTLSTAGGSGFTYSLVSGDDGDDNTAFRIAGSTLQTARVFDFEAKASYKIRIRSVKGSQQFERPFVISVTNVNEAPTALTLTTTTVAENSAPGTTISTFNTTDPDAGDRHTYTFAAGGADNTSFAIDGSVLKTRAMLNYESDSVYQISVTSQDAGDLSVRQAFTIRVRNVNEAPTAVALSQTSIAENSAIGTTIGTFGTTDPDIRDRHTYTFADGGADNASFEIDGNALKTRTALDYETDSTYAVRVKSRDAGGLEKTQAFNLKVNDVVVVATDILLSKDSIREGNAVGDTIGVLTSTPAESHGQYSLVAGAGDSDNASFRLRGDTLKAAMKFIFADKALYTIRLRTTNAAGQFEKPFTIRVKVNQAPSVPVLTSPASSATGIALNAKLIWQASTDPEGDPFTYTVLLSRTNPPTDTVAKNQPAVEYTPTRQTAGTVYYWQIIVQDDRGKVVTSSIRSYTTYRPLTAPTLTSPANNAIVDTTRTPTLKWRASDPDGDALTYDVYLGTNSPPTTKVASEQADTTFTTAKLKFKIDYYWKVVAKDGKGGEASSTVRKLTSADLGAVWVDAGATGHWSARYFSTAVTYSGKMYIMGGHDDTNPLSDVWSSTNGKDWTQVTSKAPWTCRLAHASVVFDNKIYVMGGFTTGNCAGDSSYLNDVWTYDGTNWDSVKTTKVWDGRAAMAAVVYDNKIWVMGGQSRSNSRLNDVWYSSDGKNWTKASASGHWSARRYHAATVLNDKLWIYGGNNSFDANLNDVWFSSDGISWNNTNASRHWPTRNSFQGLVAANRLLVIGGSAILRDVWYSTDGSNWTQATSSAAFGRAYHRYAATIYDSKIWLFGGISILGEGSRGTTVDKVWYTDLQE